jgi:hypothetical protein
MRNWVHGHLLLPDLPAGQRAFFEWLRDCYRDIEIRSYKDHPEVREIVENYLTVSRPRPQQCYANAFNLSCLDHEISYVVGYAQAFLPIVHAWNSFGDFHFDLTAEVALGNLKRFTSYASIYALSHPETMKVAGMCGVLGPEISDYYYHFVQDTKGIEHGKDKAVPEDRSVDYWQGPRNVLGEPKALQG